MYSRCPFYLVVEYLIVLYIYTYIYFKFEFDYKSFHTKNNSKWRLSVSPLYKYIVWYIIYIYIIIICFIISDEVCWINFCRKHCIYYTKYLISKVVYYNKWMLSTFESIPTYNRLVWIRYKIQEIAHNQPKLL